MRSLTPPDLRVFWLCRIRETIAPAGFEGLTALGARYGHYIDVESVPGLLDRFGLRIGEHLTGGWTPGR